MEDSKYVDVDVDVDVVREGREGSGCWVVVVFGGGREVKKRVRLDGWDVGG